jgi:SAM-dependent methyltransferase
VDPLRFSLVAHGALPFWNPAGEESFDAVLARAALPPDPRILDVGCGPGGHLLRLLARRTDASGVGIDRAGPAIERARAAAAAEGLTPRVEFRQEEFAPSRLEGAVFDLVLCVGSTHAAGSGTAAALEALVPLVAPGGCLLLGEGFWEQAPHPDYLALLGAARTDYRDLEGTVALGQEAGLVPEAIVACSREEWDRYEDTYHANMKRFLASHPDDPDAPAMRARIRAWRDGYLRWGRDTLGFALFLMRRP